MPLGIKNLFHINIVSAIGPKLILCSFCFHPQLCILYSQRLHWKVNVLRDDPILTLELHFEILRKYFFVILLRSFGCHKVVHV